MRKIILVATAVAIILTLGACTKEAPPVQAQEQAPPEERTTPEQASKIGEAMGAIRDAKTLIAAHKAYQAKTAGFTTKMREQVDVVYDARFANAIAATKGNRAEINALRAYIITHKNIGCVATNVCEVGETPEQTARP